MTTASAVGLSGDVRLLRTLKTVLPSLNMKVIAPPAPVPSADAASPAEIRLALIDADYPDTAAVLKWLEPDRRIPVILMWEDSAPLPRALRGAAAVLSKPVDPNKLRAAVELVVPDWEEPFDHATYLADILDLFGPANKRDDSADRPGQDGRSAGKAAEDEIDRILGPALAEIGISAKKNDVSAPLPSPLPPKTVVLPAPPPASAPEKSPVAEGPDRSSAPPAGMILCPEPTPEDAESFFASLEPSTRQKGSRSKTIYAAAGLAMFAIVGAAYFGFARRTAKSAPAAVLPGVLRMVDTASARTEKPALSVERISVSAPSPGQASFKEPNPPAAKPERTIVSPPAAGPQRAPKSKAADKEKPASIENPAPSIPKMEPQSIPLAALNLTLKSEPPEINDPAAKAKTEPLPAVPKTAAEPALSPMPVKSGDLVDLSAVDVIPALINSEKPVYPPLAYRNREEAKVKLSVLISEKGEVIDARLADDPSVNQGFAKAALRAVRRWVYSPALKSGTAVRVWKTVIIDFKIR